jgi:hypothetical protein
MTCIIFGLRGEHVWLPTASELDISLTGTITLSHLAVKRWSLVFALASALHAINTNSLLSHHRVVQTSISVPFNAITVRSIPQSPTPSLHGPYVNPRPLLHHYCAIGTSFSVPHNSFTAAFSTGPAAAWVKVTQIRQRLWNLVEKLVIFFNSMCNID